MNLKLKKFFQKNGKFFEFKIKKFFQKTANFYEKFCFF